MATNIDLDTIVKAIHELSYPDLRMLAESLSDILDETKLDADRMVPVLYTWSRGWEPSNGS